jgi:uncharacterized membrane protein
MNQSLSKKIFFILFLLINIFPVIGFAGIPTNGSFTASDYIGNPTSGGSGSGSEYTPITPSYQSLFEGLGGGGFEGMLQRIFEITVYFTVILSVIMMIWGGVEYMGSESVFKKGEGKDRIKAALTGLLVALVSILIISTIVQGGTGNAFEVDIFNDQN